VVKRSDTYLVCLRPAHKRHGGHWEFPGGKLEGSETHFDAAKRELAEELGVEVTGVDRVALSVADVGSDFVIDFVLTRIAGEPKAIEHTDIRWVSEGELHKLDLAPSDRHFVETGLKSAQQ
jgi:mutator protein MutT